MIYPIEIEFPNLARWKNGNTSLPYVWEFRGDAAGPHVCVSALVHGNEVCGAVAADRLLSALHEGARVVQGTLSIVFVNVAAYDAFNRAMPYLSRFVDEDFNRLWNEATLDGERSSRELARARELRSHFDRVDHLLDLHSMLDGAAAIALAGDTQKGLQLARALAMPEFVLIDSGHAAGKRLRDYAEFGDPASAKSALLIECGQHWEKKSGEVATQAMWRFLRHFDIFDHAWLAERIDRNVLPPQRVIEISQVVTMASDRFDWISPPHGLDIVKHAGTVIARDGGNDIVTPHDDAILVMPVPHPKQGQTAVRIGRFVDH